MHPFTAHYLAKMRMEELRREADRYRLAAQFKPPVGTPTRIRQAAGSYLIRVGERVLPDPTVRVAGFQR